MVVFVVERLLYMGNMKIKVSNNNNNKNVLERTGSGVDILLYIGWSPTNLYRFYFLISYSLLHGNKKGKVTRERVVFTKERLLHGNKKGKFTQEGVVFTKERVLNLHWVVSKRLCSHPHPPPPHS